MKYAEINKRYTEIVAEYMAKGYSFSSAVNGSPSVTVLPCCFCTRTSASILLTR